MTITMTSKNQITLPKKIVDTLRLHKGSLFDVKVSQSRIELFPLTIKEKEFTKQDCAKLEKIFQKEKKSAKKITEKFIENIA